MSTELAHAVEEHDRFDSSARHSDWRKGALLGGAVAVGTTALALIDPRDSGVPVCWSAGIFGIDCPLCGGLRCVNSLARGDWLTAADHNVVLAIALPLVAVAWAMWMIAAVQRRSLRLPRVSNWVWGTLICTVAAFTVVRNMDLGPVAHWLAASAG